MRFSLATIILTASSAAAFAPTTRWGSGITALRSTVEKVGANIEVIPLDVEAHGQQQQQQQSEPISTSSHAKVTPLTADEINARLNAQLDKLREKDQLSLELCKEDIKIVFEDEHIIVIDKPSGVLTVAGKGNHPCLANAVFDNFESSLPSGDHMIVHRLGMDTSGLIVLAKTTKAVRHMNTIFRTRKIERQYEALVCGHVDKDEGLINLPLMRDYEFPPYVRVSTDDHQVALLDLTHEEVGKKLLEGPKKSITKYEVKSREEIDGHPVTRVVLTSISGRYHQLNVHLAAFGHPIVGDTTYGINGDAVANGGLTDAEAESLAPNPQRVSVELQKAIADSISGKPPHVHAKSLKFRHPVTLEVVEFSSDAPF